MVNVTIPGKAPTRQEPARLEVNSDKGDTERIAAGKALRDSCPGWVHAAWKMPLSLADVGGGTVAPSPQQEGSY
jgi:hypothetical protein